MMHVLPHWNWPDRVGLTVPIYCYTNYPKAELFVNGKSMGIRQKDTGNKYTRYRLIWNNVVYQPGEIKVVAYNANNVQVDQRVIKTADNPHTIKLTSDKNTVKADGKDLIYVTVDVVDKLGNLCPRTSNLLFFKVEGAGKLKAVCNGDATNQTAFTSSYMNVFNGKLVAIIEPSNVAGNITLQVSGGLLQPQQIILNTILYK